MPTMFHQKNAQQGKPAQSVNCRQAFRSRNWRGKKLQWGSITLPDLRKYTSAFTDLPLLPANKASSANGYLRDCRRCFLRIFTLS